MKPWKIYRALSTIESYERPFLMISTLYQRERKLPSISLEEMNKTASYMLEMMKIYNSGKSMPLMKVIMINKKKLWKKLLWRRFSHEEISLILPTKIFKKINWKTNSKLGYSRRKFNKRIRLRWKTFLTQKKICLPMNWMISLSLPT